MHGGNWENKEGVGVGLKTCTEVIMDTECCYFVCKALSLGMSGIV